jgi:ABC-type transport system involved in multi-copper enzyme maturation permease subunit
MPITGGAPRRSLTYKRPGIARLTLVELRKMVNTRSGFWVSIGIAGITLLTAIIASANHGGRDATLTHVLHAAGQPAAYLLPVMGVLLICSEWSQRTKLTTFTLVPSRARVIAAKLGASWIVSTVALVVILLLSVVTATVFGHHPGGIGSVSWQVLTQSWVYLAATMVVGLGFGAAILVSAPAIVLYLLLPLVWGALVSNISALDGVARWLDSSQTLSPMAQHSLTGIQWAHALVTLAVWAGIPILIGWVRMGRGDID